MLENTQERYETRQPQKPTSVPINRVCRSKELFSALQAIQQDTEVGKYILDVRGLGLMVGVEFASPSVHPSDPGYNANAPKNFASRVQKKCLEKGLYILTTSIYEVIRFIPALNISKVDLEKGTKIFSEAVRETVREG